MTNSSRYNGDSSDTSESMRGQDARKKQKRETRRSRIQGIKEDAEKYKGDYVAEVVRDKEVWREMGRRKDKGERDVYV